MRIHKVLPFLLALAALPAEATPTYYCSDASCGTNTEAAFNAAFGVLLAAGLTSSGTVNFTGASSGTTVSNVVPTQVDFTAFGAGGATLNVVGSQLRQSASGAGTGVLLDLSSGAVYALGVHITQAAGTKTWCFETIAQNCDAMINVTGGGVSFVGVLSTVVVLPNQQIRSLNGGQLYVNDFDIADAPEASTFVLVGTGLMLFPLLKRKTRRVLAVEPSLQC